VEIVTLRFWPLLLSLVLSGADVADVAAAVEAPPLDALIARAIAETPDLRALEARIAAAEARASGAGGLPPTMTEFRLRRFNAPHSGERETMPEVMIRQPLLFPGKASARTAASRAEVSVLEARSRSLRQEVTRVVATYYASLYETEQERRMLETARELLVSMAKEAGTRYATTGGDLAAAARAEVEISHLDARLLDLELARASAAAGFGAFFRDDAASEWTVSSLPEITPELTTEIDSIVPRAERAAPEVRVAEAELKAARAMRRMTGRERLPDLSIGAEVAKPRELDAEYTGMVVLELPLFSRRGAEVRAADSEIVAAEAELQNARARARAEAGRLRAVWSAMEAHLVLHGEQVLLQDQTALELARISYANGRGEFSAVLDAYRAWLDDRILVASIRAERLVTWAEIRALTPAED